MKSPGLRLAIILGLATLSIVGRLAFVWLPNVSLSLLVLAVAGVAYGARVGSAVGFLGRLGSDLLISGLNPIVFPMVLVETAIGFVIGIMGHRFDLQRVFMRANWWTRLVLFDAGLFLTFGYSVASDSVTWVFYNLILHDAPDAATGQLWTTLVIMGLVFNIVPAILHGILFAASLPPILRGLDAASLLPEPKPSPPPAAETTDPSAGP